MFWMDLPPNVCFSQLTNNDQIRDDNPLTPLGGVYRKSSAMPVKRKGGAYSVSVFINPVYLTYHTV